MKTFLVSLKKESRRRSQLESDLKRVQLDYEIFDAVNGYELADTELDRLCDREEIQRNASWYSKGMIGCSLSHYYLYKKIIDEKLPYAFIIEDDARLPDNILELLSATEKHLSSNEVILFYYQSIRGICEISKADEIRLNRQHSLNYPMSPSNVSTTGAYIITAAGCESMMQVILPIRKGPDDWNFFWENGLQSVRIVYPRPVETYDFRSTISNLSNFKKKTFTSVIVDIVDKHKIYPFYQLLAKRRRKRKEGVGGDFLKVDKRSPIKEQLDLQASLKM